MKSYMLVISKFLGILILVSTLSPCIEATEVTNDPIDDRALEAAAAKPIQGVQEVESEDVLTPEDFEIPGGPPAQMLRDFYGMFPDWDFYEEPSKELKDQFVKEYPIWGPVIKRIEKDDQKRMKSEEFFDAHGTYPTAESHGEAPLSEYLMDYLEYEKEGAVTISQTASSDLEAEIRALFPGWTGEEITPPMEEKFNQTFAQRNFGSWNPLFYGDAIDEDFYEDEDVDEGLIYEEDESENGFLDENWLMEEIAEKPSPTPTPSSST